MRDEEGIFWEKEKEDNLGFFLGGGKLHIIKSDFQNPSIQEAEAGDCCEIEA